MANFMYILRPTKACIKTVCPTCTKRGMVMDSCDTCHGKAFIKHSIPQYYVQDKPIEITRVDRDATTGILRYWENMSEFYYETTYPSLNKFTPGVPYGIHLLHDNKQSAQAECDRINGFLFEANK